MDFYHIRFYPSFSRPSSSRNTQAYVLVLYKVPIVKSVLRNLRSRDFALSCLLGPSCPSGPSHRSLLLGLVLYTTVYEVHSQLLLLCLYAVAAF